MEPRLHSLVATLTERSSGKAVDSKMKPQTENRHPIVEKFNVDAELPDTRRRVQRIKTLSMNGVLCQGKGDDEVRDTCHPLETQPAIFPRSLNASGDHTLLDHKLESSYGFMRLR
ncbi:hypothetical protein NL676_007060 [Syzygium grande]|nr:hypothetical protein NL676_007060 [Syzygium grande]